MFTSRPNAICSPEEVLSRGPWAADNAEHKIQTLVFIFLSVLVNIHNCPLFPRLVTLCLSPKNGKHTSIPFPRIPPAFFGSQVTATLTGPATPCSHHSFFDRLRPARPFAMLSTRMLSTSNILSANQLILYITRHVPTARSKHHCLYALISSPIN